MTSSLEPFTVEIAASELSESIVARFRERPQANTRFSVTVAPVESDGDRLAALRRHIQQGLDDIDAGRVIDADAAFAVLRAGCRAS